MKNLKTWLLKEENHSFARGNTLSLILDELATHDNVAIKVGGNFPMTYNLLATVSQRTYF